MGKKVWELVYVILLFEFIHSLKNHSTSWWVRQWLEAEQVGSGCQEQ